MTTVIQIHTFGTNPSLAIDGWELNADGLDYSSERAKALYAALEVSPRDEEYALAVHHETGRWGLFGLIVTGYSYAVEE